MNTQIIIGFVVLVFIVTIFLIGLYKLIKQHQNLRKDKLNNYKEETTWQR